MCDDRRNHDSLRSLKLKARESLASNAHVNLDEPIELQSGLHHPCGDACQGLNGFQSHEWQGDALSRGYISSEGRNLKSCRQSVADSGDAVICSFLFATLLGFLICASEH